MRQSISPIIEVVGPGFLRPVRGLRVIVKCGGNVTRLPRVHSACHRTKAVAVT
jgi:hypothetical protein